MGRTTKYPGVSLAAVKKFCRHCVKLNGDTSRKNRHEYAGLAEENGSYYLVDGYRMIRFFEDVPELDHAPVQEIGGQPSMLQFIENAHKMAEKMGKSAEIELPDLEEVRAAAAYSKHEAKKRTLGGPEVTPMPLGDGRIWVNPAYLLDMIQIFPLQRIACMTGNAFQPILFGCDGADGILIPMCNKTGMTVEQYNDRLEQFKETLAAQEPQKKPVRRSVKRDNLGQPTSLAQLKKRLTVGAAFEISTVDGDLQQRRVIKAQTNAVVSIVPFDDTHKINANDGSWIFWGKASDWRFEDGLCVYCGGGVDAVFCIRLIDTTPKQDECYNAWMTGLEAQRVAEKERK